MTEQSIDILFGLIKFDMNQIQNYREAIFNISVAVVAASFGISAFIYRKDCELSSGYKARIITDTNVLLLLVTAVVAYKYYEGLHGSRAALEMRQDALTAHLFKHIPLTDLSLYPNPPDDYPCHMTSTLEMIPLYLSLVIVGAKAIVEGMLFTRACNDKTVQEKPPYAI